MLVLALNIYFYSNTGEVCRLETIITSNIDNIEGNRYSIIREKLWRKSVSDVKTRKNLIEFNEVDLILERNQKEEFLSEDVSVMIAQNKKIKNI